MITVDDCRQLVGTYYHIPKDVMLSKQRAARIARPRQMAMVLAREFTGASYPRIGARFGGRDHTTVLHAVKAVEQREKKSAKIAHKMEQFRVALRLFQAQALTVPEAAE